MRAILKDQSAPGLVMGEVPRPVPKADEVLIKILKTSICGTDIHIEQWDEWARRTLRPPLVIGHEFVGQVEAVGDRVSGFSPGELVSGEGHLVCGHCRNCISGRPHLCPNTLGVGVNRDGAFAEYLCIPRTNVWHVHPSVPLEVASCFDPLGNAVHTALAFDILGEDILITGAGPIGCMAAAICRQAGARHIVVTDPNPYRRRLAQSMGATRTVDPLNDQLADVMRDLGMKEGFDVGLEMSGHPAALEQMIAHMFHGGNIALLGILPPDGQIDWTKVIFYGLTLKGIYGRKMYETWYKMSVLLQGGLDITSVITHRFPAERFEEAFTLMASGKAGKIILEWAQP